MKQSDSNLLKHSSGAIADTAVDSVDALISASTGVPIPALRLAWELSKSLLGNAVELRKQRAIEWVQAIIDDPATFNEQVVGSQEFQDGFVVALEDYLKLRDYMKRRVALKAFKEFASSDDKVEFPLERYNDTLRKISPASLRTLAFVKYSVIPAMEVKIKENLQEKNLGTEKPLEWWYEREMNSEPFSKYDDTGTLASMSDQLGELQFLGLVRSVSAIGGGWGFNGGGAITGQALTGFAKKFIAFIEEDAELKNNSIIHDTDESSVTP